MVLNPERYGIEADSYLVYHLDGDTLDNKGGNAAELEFDGSFKAGGAAIDGTEFFSGNIQKRIVETEEFPVLSPPANISIGFE